LSNFQATTPTAITINLSWTASEFIDHFKITYSYIVKNCSDIGGPLTISITDGSKRSYLLSDLNEDSTYTITITAFSIMTSTTITASADTLTSGNADYML
jgi:hypothetical protein